MKMLGLVSVLIAAVGWGNSALASLWVLASAASDDSAASANKVPELSLEFFDYLGSMVKRDGEWIDPLTLDEQLAEDASSQEDIDAQAKVSEVEQ